MNRIYKHYKGKLYEVIGVCYHTENEERCVLYKALYDTDLSKEEYGDEPLFVRPYTMFFEEVEIDGKKFPRFKFIKNN